MDVVKKNLHAFFNEEQRNLAKRLVGTVTAGLFHTGLFFPLVNDNISHREISVGTVEGYLSYSLANSDFVLSLTFIT